MIDGDLAKRAFDLALAALGLVLLSPLLAAIALAVTLDSPGPVFFRQERVGRGGVPFRIHKFRTMRHDAAGAGPQLTVGADARITRVGAFLRRTKLDELAQLLDVLAGSMSLVGPRPEVPRYVALYRQGRLPVDKLLTHRLKLDDINEGFERLREGRAVRQVVLF